MIRIHSLDPKMEGHLLGEVGASFRQRNEVALR